MEKGRFITNKELIEDDGDLSLRPKTFDEYIGQEKVKAKSRTRRSIRLAIRGVPRDRRAIS